MAIQFNCPYCTSQIRVPDSAAGKRGNCPRCRTGILVPAVSAKPDPGESQPTHKEPAEKPKKTSPRRRILDDPPDFSGLPGVETPPADATASADVLAAPPVVTDSASMESVPAVSAPPSLPLNVAATGASVDTPYTRALKRRRQRGRFVWIPILFGVVLVGGVALFFLLVGDGKLEGTLNAVAIPDAEIETRTIAASMADVDETQIETVAKDLRESGYQFRDLAGFEYEVTVDGGDLKLRVESSDTTPLFRVSVKDDKTLRAFLKDNAETLNRPREREWKAGLKRFLEKSADSLNNGGQIPIAMKDVFKRKVAANLLVRGAGYNLIAVVRERAYLCFYEDKQGRLYFPLPKGTTKFTLKGRKLADGRRLFPGNYTVLVGGTVKPGPAKTSQPKTGKTGEDP